MPSLPTGLSQWRSRIASLFQDHEIFVRTHGHVRFLRISAAVQMRVVAIAATVLLAWAAFTVAMLVNQWLTADERAAVAAQGAKAAAAQARIDQYRDRVAETAADLDARQNHLDERFNEHFGNDMSALPAAEGAVPSEPLKTSFSIDPSLPPEAQALARIEARQEAFAGRLLAAVNARAAQAETAVTKLGLNPNALVQNAARGRGGPFIPYTGRMGRAKALGPSFAALEGALFRMEVLERTLVAMPSGKPASITLMSSGFGYRSDPFTGGGAMHNGLDFKGPIGTPILAAAPGRIHSVGTQGGYGQTIEIDHGQGVMTRYAHLSGYDARVGDVVAAGEQIGRMGSTGRSTGSHLHFEVHINGAAVNPRRFLEVNKDVLEAKADARERVAAVERSR